MGENKDLIDALASMMEEYRLEESKLTLGGLTVAFSRRVEKRPSVESDSSSPEVYYPPQEQPAAQPAAAAGTPVTSPMNGIFYRSPSPGSPPFVREGDSVNAGQTIGLIEAMKVFNEIPCPISGTVIEYVAETGALVLPGEVLLRIS